jgi:hypothetical protein
MATQIDFIVRNGLQVTTNAVIGSYATVNPAPINGMIVSGNVGIGTATPVQKLQVVGNIQLTNVASSISGIYFADGTYQATSASSYSTPPGGSTGSIQYNNGGTFGGTTTFIYHSGNAHVGIGTNQANYTLQVVSTDGPALFSTLNGSNYQIGIGTASANAIVGYNGTGQYGYLSTGANQATPALVITQGGRIGIGTTVPTSNLDVKGSMAIGSYAGVSTPPSNSLIISGNIGIGITNPTSSKIDVLAGADQLGIQIKSDSTSPGGFLSFIDGATSATKFVIDSQGQVSAGVWQGTAVTPAYGGIGSVGGSLAAGDLLYAQSDVSTLQRLPIGGIGNVLLAGALSPSWGNISLSSSSVSGVLPIANGGTNAAAFSGNAFVVTTSNGLVMTSITRSTNAAVVFNNSGVPTSVTGGPYTYLTTGVGGGALSFSNINLQYGVGSSVLQVSNGGTGIPSIPQYALLYGSANTSVMGTLASAATSALVTGATSAPQWTSGTVANRVLRTDGTNITFSQVALTTDVTGTLPVGNGGTGTATQFTLGSVVFAGASGVYTQDNSNFFWDNTNNRLGLATTSPTTTLDVNGAATIRNGANVVAGGLYVQAGVGNFVSAVIADSLTSNSYVKTSFLNATTSANVAGLTSNTTIIVNGTTDATSTTSGALIVAGGVGIAKTLWVGNAAFIQGNLTVGGNLIVSGNVTYINSNITTIEDPVIALGTGPNGANLTVADTYDRGLEFHYFSGGADRYGFMGWQNSTGRFTYIANATGNLSTQVYTGPFGDAQFGNIIVSGGLNTPIPSTSTSTGAIVIGGTGGLGVGGNIYAGGSINTTGNITAGNLTVTGTLNAQANSAINASNVSVTLTTTNSTFYPAFVEATTGNLGVRVDSTLTYNPSTDLLTVGEITFTGSTIPANGVYLPSANTLGFATNTTSRVTIDANGIVGIGTSAASTSATTGALTVTGGVGIGGNAYVGNALWAGNASITNTTPTTSATTGALTVAGGVGINGNAFVNNSAWVGNIYVINTTPTSSGTTGALVVNGGVGINSNIFVTGSGRIGNLYIANTTTTTSPSTGALLVGGGVGIGGNAYVANSIWAGNIGVVNTTPTTSATTGAITVAGGVGIAGGAYVGNGLWAGNASVMNLTAATSSTTGGLVVAGGVGVGGNVYVNNSLWAGNAYITNATTTTSATTGALVVAGGIGVTTNVYVNNSVWAGNLSIMNATPSTSTTSGALTVAGGIGVAGNVYAANIYTTGTFFGVANTAINASNVVITATTTNATFYPTFVEATSGNVGVRVDTTLTYNPATDTLTIGGNVNVANSGSFGNLSITNTTASTTTTAGALTVAGAVGVGGNLTVGNAGRFGNIYVSNTTAATNPTSGALTVAGGVGIGGALYVGGIIDAQSIDATAIGNGTPSTGQFTSVVVQGTANVSVLQSNSTVSGNSFILAGNVRTGISTVGSVTLDSFDATTYRTAHYIAQVTDNTASPLRYYSTQIMVMHDGPAPNGGSANAYISEYNMMYSNAVLGTFDATFTGAANVVSLTMTPINTNNMTVRLMRSTVLN